MNSLAQLHWQCCPFAELNNAQLHAIYAARCAVFVVEQHCAYQDIDGLDPACHHLIAWTADRQVAAYLRIVPPGRTFAEPALGRVLSTADWRGSGVGKQLIANGIQALQDIYSNQAIRINAQAYLEKFYGCFGFQTVSDVYLEDGIPAIEMLLAAD